MKKLILSAGILFLAFSVTAQVKMPAPSPTQHLKQDFGLSSIELVYSRPGLKGRNMIGNIEPWGVVWRTGANATSKITFHDDVEVAGTPVKAGTYAVYTIPEKDGNWKFILNTGVKNAGVVGYKQSEDVVRTTIKAMNFKTPVETLTMQIADVKPESCILMIRWEDFGLRIPITTKIKDRIKAQIAEAMKGDKKPYWQAAQFYDEFMNDKPKALEMINALLAQSDKPAFYQVYYKAKLQKEMGDKKGAMATAQKSYELSKEAGNANYMLLNKKIMADVK